MDIMLIRTEFVYRLVHHLRTVKIQQLNVFQLVLQGMLKELFV